MDDLRALARAVLLAFADLGVYLPSNRERLFRKVRFLDTSDAGVIAHFVNACIDAGLIHDADAGHLRLHPGEARRLAVSMDGHTPVPDDQAHAWATLLGGASPA